MLQATIVVPTFRRPDLLQNTLRSCVAQTGLAANSFEIVVVDNAPEGSARGAVAAFASEASVAVRYLAEPNPGISHARNAGMAAARSPRIAFLDDDEIAAPDWLARLLAAMNTYEADVVLAPVLSEVGGETGSAAAFARAFFTCSADAPTGTRIGSRILAPFRRRRELVFPRLASGNALLDLRSPHLRRARFDSRLGRTGGEDTLFFSQLLADGARLVWCAEAVATERLGSDRISSAFIARRAFRGGQIVSWMPLLLRRKAPWLTAYSMTAGALQACVYGLLGLLLRLAGSPGWLAPMQKAMTGLGKVFWMSPFRADSYGAPVAPRAGAPARA